MRILLYITLFSFGSWGLAAGLLTAVSANDLFFSMAGPWLMGVLTLYFSQRTFKSDPEKLTSTMIKGFFGKILFYGAYVVILALTGTVSLVPFMVGFAVYFIVLHGIEALYLRTLFEPIKT